MKPVQIIQRTQNLVQNRVLLKNPAALLRNQRFCRALDRPHRGSHPHLEQTRPKRPQNPERGGAPHHGHGWSRCPKSSSVTEDTRKTESLAHFWMQGRWKREKQPPQLHTCRRRDRCEGAELVV